ncbi:carbohydrate ABC transporter permease [Ketogulonicigenium vulgare]|uniref:ABC transporter, permease protein, putative n=1 Tax=Ketogulonicigenium vulgare (strain WSH-001) TaxID=759362 RepID=F9YA69_KETVW|nr:sugar ABC transporter permease [Ketogulonicigenium vulgare]ADO43186.1 ABC transporter, membrane spanning protein (sugar) [Ketogulonicigenium vulgare Y25]AEM41480.1 ABC transporter, permease protein, putative [Ketogulonicigenium vulgare WSH-001]ALJ81613.1 ABC transporter permease [Ketogulonicigenium vulgare]ANW34289.1 ABC transporter permease [Ketogulonicigenium vulgare]AOZ55222.1 sugar ABC transporter transmembrane protein [Ketogulonicigenium vulgare]
MSVTDPNGAAEGRPGLWNRLGIRTKHVLWAWAFLAIPVLFYVVIRFYPTFDAFWLSLTDGNIRRGPSFIGLENYARMYADPVFWKVFGNTFLYLLIGTPVSLVISFTIAYYLDRVRFMHGLIRALYFLPYLTTAAAMGWVWRFLYQPVPIGMINSFLTSIGLEQQPFLRSTDQALMAATIPAIWAGLGFQIIIFMAGLRAIPSSFYEAARIDGLGEWAILRKITLPLLKPTTIFLVVLSSIGFLRIFDQVQSLTANDPGGPLNATKPLVMLIYQTAFSSFRMGYASAQTVILFLVLLLISLLQLWLLRDKK